MEAKLIVAAQAHVGREPAALAQEIRSLMDQRPPKRWQQMERHGECEARRSALMLELGRRRGWRPARRSFGPRLLASGRVHYGSDWYGRAFDEWGAGWVPPDDDFGFGIMDHPYDYRDALGRPAATAGHLYDLTADKRRACEDYAAQIGLIVEFPDFPSWWNPGATGLVLYTRRPPGPRPLAESERQALAIVFAELGEELRADPGPHPLYTERRWVTEMTLVDWLPIEGDRLRRLAFRALRDTGAIEVRGRRYRWTPAALTQARATALAAGTA